MVVSVLRVLAVLGTGTAAGVLFAVAVSVLPALNEMPVDRYVYSHTLIGRNWDPTMPIMVMGTSVVDIVLAILVRPVGPRLLFLVAAVLLAGVSTVSHLGNVPINRIVKSTDPERVPADWHDPRPRWRQWHTLRTVLAMLALFVTAVAVTGP